MTTTLPVMIRYIFLLIVFLGRTTTAFQPVRRGYVFSAHASVLPNTQSPRSDNDVAFVPLTVRHLKPSKKVDPIEREQQEWDFGLVFTYMTPWKNPNSIFVYMFAALYFLGKYSESQHMAGQ